MANNGEIVKNILCKITVSSLLYYLIFHIFINLGFLTPTWDFFGAQSWDFEKTRVEALVESVEREETWGGVSPHHSTRVLEERRKLHLHQRGPPRPKMDFMHISGQIKAVWILERPFQYF